MLEQTIRKIVGVPDVVGTIRALENVHPESHRHGRYTNRGAAANAHSPFDRLRVSGVTQYVAIVMAVGTKYSISQLR